MLDIDNQTQESIELNNIKKIYKALCDKDIELILLNDDKIKEINYKYRGKNSATDVLSFPLLNMPNTPLGSILISVDMAKKASKEFNHSLSDELALLFIHGFLHLSGYDHEKDDGQMREKECELIKKFSLPTSLIIRSEKS